MLKIVPRAGWNARPPERKIRMRTPSPRLWLHHSAAEWHNPSGVRQTQNYHMDSRGYDDVAYSFLVDDDGTVYEGRGAGVVGGHTKGDNSSSHAICAMGDFTKRQPTPAMIDSIVALVAHGHREGWWPDHITGGHRDAPGAQTACPGDRLARLIPEINRRAGSPKTDAYQGDLLMAVALDDDDARRCLVRQWFWQYLGRGPRTAEEQNLHVWVFGSKGADVCLAGIVDSPEAKRHREEA